MRAKCWRCGHRPAVLVLRGATSLLNSDTYPAAQAALLNSAARAFSRLRREAPPHLAGRAQRGRHRGRILRRDKDSVATPRQDLRGSVPAIGRDDRRAASHGFGQRDPEALGARRQHEHVRAAEPRQWVILEADEVDCVGNPKFMSKVLKVLTQRSSTQDQQPPLPAILAVDRHCPQQCLLVLLWDQTCCRDVNRRHAVTEPGMDRRHVGTFLKPRADHCVVYPHDLARWQA